jgi:hypothetical protein
MAQQKIQKQGPIKDIYRQQWVLMVTGMKSSHMYETA